MDFETILHPRRIHGTDIFLKTEMNIRSFFQEKGYQETPTPLLVPNPGMEPHIHPFEVRPYGAQKVTHFLPTSPEFAMKKLLAGGLEKIFQMSSAFRFEPTSRCHQPEFRMLEWYQAHVDEKTIQKEIQELVYFLSTKILKKTIINFNDEKIDLTLPWPKKTVDELFIKHIQHSIYELESKESFIEVCKKNKIQVHTTDTWDDLFFKIWLNKIEPFFPKNRPLIVTEFPASQAALSTIGTTPSGNSFARRFEVFMGGLEIANAFHELTDPTLQRKRFKKDMDLRSETYGETLPKTPIEEDFLEAVEKLPPCAGIAVGIDRLVMLLANEPEIQYLKWLPHF